MQFDIQTLDGEEIVCDLEQIGRSFPDEGVIYVRQTPCRLSSARPYLPEITQLLDRLGIWADNPNILSRVEFALRLMETTADNYANAGIALEDIRRYAETDIYIAESVAYGLGRARRPPSP